MTDRNAFSEVSARAVGRARRLWELISSGLWFVPTVIVAGAVIAAFVLVQLDTQIGPDLLGQWPLIFGTGAEGARSMLVAIASSMITVAGVAFSITIVALSLASSQYTSRVLRNFMSDRMNQIVLGVFIGIFAYCILILRTIRGGDDDAFVAPVSVTFAVVLAFVGIGFFVYFLHHIAVSIQAAHILANIHQETARAIDHLFPQTIGQAASEAAGSPTGDGDADLEDSSSVDWTQIDARRSGYLTHIDGTALIRWAQRQDRVLRIPHQIGEFVIDSEPLLFVAGKQSLADDESNGLHDAFAVRRQRTVSQDAAFGIRQIVDIALKALSPGINDTTTAVMCLNYLAAILVQLADRDVESRSHRFDDDGTLRVIVQEPSFAGLLDGSLDQIRHHAAGNVAVLEQMIGILKRLLRVVEDSTRRQAVDRHIERLGEVIGDTVASPIDREELVLALNDLR